MMQPESSLFEQYRDKLELVYDGDISRYDGINSNAYCLTPIMDAVATYTEAYRTDLIYDILRLQKTILLMREKLLPGEEEPVYCLGVRRLGVDASTLLQTRLQYPDVYGSASKEFPGGVFIITLTDEDAPDELTLKVYRIKEL